MFVEIIVEFLFSTESSTALVIQAPPVCYNDYLRVIADRNCCRFPKRMRTNAKAFMIPLYVYTYSSQIPKEAHISEGHLSGIAVEGDGDHTSVDVHFGMASLAIIQRKGHMEMTDAAGLSLEQVAHP